MEDWKEIAREAIECLAGLGCPFQWAERVPVEVSSVSLRVRQLLGCDACTYRFTGENNPHGSVYNCWLLWFKERIKK